MLLKRTKFTKIYLLSTILFCGIAGGCNKPAKDITGFDEAAWRGDVRSCRNIRPTLVESLRNARDQFMGLNHREIIALLGKPEGESLESSAMRSYYYFTQAGPQCEKKPSTASKVSIRFDALDRVDEIIFINKM